MPHQYIEIYLNILLDKILDISYILIYKIVRDNLKNRLPQSRCKGFLMTVQKKYFVRDNIFIVHCANTLNSESVSDIV